MVNESSTFQLSSTSWILIVTLAVCITFFAPYFFEDHTSYRAIDHQLGAVNTLTVDGSRRSIISNDRYSCAEPAPDAMSTIATNFAAGVSSNDGQGLVEIMRDPATQVLFRRTQGIQAIRDGMFRLCEAQMNGAVEHEFYEEQMTDLLMTLNFIVPLELCINAGTKIGELFSSTDSSIEEEKVDAIAQTDGLSAVQSINTHLTFCLNVSKDYGLALAENAAQTRHNRRLLKHELDLERVRIEQFRSESQ